VPAALGVALLVVVLSGFTVLMVRWSARAGWDGRHRLAAAGGGLLTYAWHSFLMHPVVGGSGALILVSHVVFALAAVVLLGFEARRVRARYGELWSLRATPDGLAHDGAGRKSGNLL